MNYHVLVIQIEVYSNWRLYLHLIFSKLLAPLVVSTCVVFKISTFGCVLHVTWIHCRSLDCGRFYIVVILHVRGSRRDQQQLTVSNLIDFWIGLFRLWIPYASCPTLHMREIEIKMFNLDEGNLHYLTYFFVSYRDMKTKVKVDRIFKFSQSSG